jgi:O-antigen/teichoic acid export membrane protein
MVDVRASLFFSFAGRYANLAINVILMVALARLLSPAETGLYSIAAGLINIAQSFREFGVSTYILQEKELTREKIASATGVCLLIAGILTLSFSLEAGAIAGFYGNLRLVPIIQVLSLNFILVAFASIGGAQMQRDMMFRAAMLTSWASTIASAVVSLGLAILNAGAISLAWGSLAGVAVGVIGNYLALGQRAFAWPTLRRWREQAHFGVFSTGSGLLTGLADRTPDLVIGRLVSLEGAGLFSRGNGLVTLFRTAVTGAIDPVIASSMAVIHRDGGDAREPLLRIFGYLSAVGWPVLVLLALLARPIILILFGPMWVGAIAVAQVLCAGTALSLIGNVCQTYLASTGAVRSNFIIQIISVPVFVAGVAGGSFVSLEGAALGAAVAGGLMTLLSLETLRRRIDLSWGAIVRSVLPSVLMTMLTALPPFALILLLGPIENGHVWMIGFAAGSGGVLAWVGSVFLVRHPLRHEIFFLGNWACRKLERVIS